MQTLKVNIEEVQSGYIVYPDGNKELMHVATTKPQVVKAAKKVIEDMLNIKEQTTNEETENGNEHQE